MPTCRPRPGWSPTPRSGSGLRLDRPARVAIDGCRGDGGLESAHRGRAGGHRRLIPAVGLDFGHPHVRAARPAAALATTRAPQGARTDSCCRLSTTTRTSEPTRSSRRSSTALLRAVERCRARRPRRSACARSARPVPMDTRADWETALRHEDARLARYGRPSDGPRHPAGPADGRRRRSDRRPRRRDRPRAVRETDRVTRTLAGPVPGAAARDGGTRGRHPRGTDPRCVRRADLLAVWSWPGDPGRCGQPGGGETRDDALRIARTRRRLSRLERPVAPRPDAPRSPQIRVLTNRSIKRAERDEPEPQDADEHQQQARGRTPDRPRRCARVQGVAPEQLQIAAIGAEGEVVESPSSGIAPIPRSTSRFTTIRPKDDARDPEPSRLGDDPGARPRRRPRRPRPGSGR